MAKDSEWRGLDADLETSLFDYHFVAKQRAEKDYPDEWFVLYQISPNAYSTGHIREQELDDLINGKEWMKEEDIERTLDFVGMTKDEWLKSDFIGKFGDIISYWGVDEIMGTDYSPMDKKEAKKKIGVSDDTEEKDKMESKTLAKKIIEVLKFMDGPKQPEGSSDIVDDKLNKEVTILQGILMNKKLGNNASLQTGSGAMINILALGAKNETPEETPDATEKPEGDKDTTAAAKVIGAASSICATESYKVSKNEFAIAQKMKAKGYRLFASGKSEAFLVPIV